MTPAEERQSAGDGDLYVTLNRVVSWSPRTEDRNAAGAIATTVTIF